MPIILALAKVIQSERLVLMIIIFSVYFLYNYKLYCYKNGRFITLLSKYSLRQIVTIMHNEVVTVHI